MATRTTPTGRFGAVDRFARGLVRTLRKLALAGALGVVPIAFLLRRYDGFGVLDGVLVLALLVPAAILLLFAQGVLELVSLPERLRRLPGEGQERLAELGRIAGDARSARARSVPFLLWRLRGSIGSLRDVAGIALPLRVVTPAFLGLTAVSALLSVALACAGVIALAVLALA